MASLTGSSLKGWRVILACPDGKRRPIRLPKGCPKRHAEGFKALVEALAQARTLGVPPDPETNRRVHKLTAETRKKLEAVGLVDPLRAITLGELTEQYLAERKGDVKPGTLFNLQQAKENLLAFFGAGKRIRDITEADAESWARWMGSEEGGGYATNTVRRRTGRVIQYFKWAVKRRDLTANPFEGLPTTVGAAEERTLFVEAEDVRRLMEAAPCAQWRLILALARWGGLRCPSEVLSLKWEHVLWDQNRIVVPSPKTEHIDGRAQRTIPLFPELLEPLLEASEQRDPQAEYCISRYQKQGRNTNLGTQFRRIAKKAGIPGWVRPFQNMRSTRETELTERFPVHVVAKWLGNTPKVAAKHYLQTTEEHFRQAVEEEPYRTPQKGGSLSGALVAQNGARRKIAGNCGASQEKAKPLGVQGAMLTSSISCKEVNNCIATRQGLEP